MLHSFVFKPADKYVRFSWGGSGYHGRSFSEKLEDLTLHILSNHEKQKSVLLSYTHRLKWSYKCTMKIFNFGGLSYL